MKYLFTTICLFVLISVQIYSTEYKRGHDLPAKITNISTYTSRNSDDRDGSVIFWLQVEGQDVKTQLWLDKNDLKFKTHLSFILLAQMTQQNVIVFYSDDYIRVGETSSANFHKVTAISLKQD